MQNIMREIWSYWRLAISLLTEKLKQSCIGLIGRLINYNQKTENASLSNGGLRQSFVER